MIISTKELRALCDLILSHVEATSGEELRVDEDYYWSVPSESRYDNYTEPTELELGQLTEDWERLREILAKESEPVGYALTWLSSLLRIVGEKSVA